MTEFKRRTRQDAERLEAELLAPGATLSTETRGRETPEEPDPYRTAFERDRDRILHSKAFRRLKHKTQVFIDPAGDHFVTRLTHTLQVTQIGRSIATFLSLNEPLTEAICLGHDVGHAPFGHTGEDALTDYVDSEWLHSQQGLRIFRTLEPINLTWEVLDGIRAHSWKIDPPPATPEGMVCRFADRIAYLTHDVLDAVRAGIIAEDNLPAAARDRFGEPGSPWIAAMIEAVIEESISTGLVAMQEDCLEVMNELREFMFTRVYLRPETEAHKRHVFTVIHALVDYFLANPTEIPDTYRNRDDTDLNQVIDYVAGMTDRYALREYETLLQGR
ncbi:MAG: HD domain-containing protein [Acidimicrobiia bacterium]|nr:HD domain-containing protein [Acidimicrobiia bacterium]